MKKKTEISDDLKLALEDFQNGQIDNGVMPQRAWNPYGQQHQASKVGHLLVSISKNHDQAVCRQFTPDSENDTFRGGLQIKVKAPTLEAPTLASNPSESVSTEMAMETDSDSPNSSSSSLASTNAKPKTGQKSLQQNIETKLQKEETTPVSLDPFSPSTPQRSKRKGSKQKGSKQKKVSLPETPSTPKTPRASQSSQAQIAEAMEDSAPAPKRNSFLTPNGRNIALPIEISTPGGTILNSGRQLQITLQEGDSSPQKAHLLFLSPERTEGGNCGKRKREIHDNGDEENPKSKKAKKSSKAKKKGQAKNSKSSKKTSGKKVRRTLALGNMEDDNFSDKTKLVDPSSIQRSDSQAEDLQSSLMSTNSDASQSHTRPVSPLIFSLPAAAKTQSDDMSIGPETKTEAENIPIKGGDTTRIILCKRKRKAFKKQKEVQGQTAREALETAKNELLEKLFPETFDDFTGPNDPNDPTSEAINNKLKVELKKRIEKAGQEKDSTTLEDLNTLEIMLCLLENHSIHWGHVLAFSLYPKGLNPQTVENLTVTPDFINYLMMVLEGVARHFAKRPKGEGEVHVSSTFKMLTVNQVATQIAKELYYAVAITNGNREVTAEISLPTLCKPNRSNTASHTDMSQTIAVMTALLEDIEPSQSFIIEAGANPKVKPRA